MSNRTPGGLLTILVLVISFSVPVVMANSGGSWSGLLRDEAGNPVTDAILKLSNTFTPAEYSATSTTTGKFAFSQIPAGTYKLSVQKDQKVWKLTDPIVFKEGTTLTDSLELPLQKPEILLIPTTDEAIQQSSGGEHLSGGKVSSLPLNARDFSKLLLLAAGTMTDTNGAANFTQQYSVNGQRGTATVFAMDAADTTDPELGGATFSNFNVDAIQEVQGSAGVMPAEIGHGGASYSNVVTKSGTNQLHGSAFEFLRNASLDARNFFDHSTAEDPRRIPPFIRNEFGFTLGGPVVLPKLYDGPNRTYFFGEYQGFRQILGTTQVFAVPTAAERQGIDTTTFPGDTLFRPR